jgi:hypothetical protein
MTPRSESPRTSIPPDPEEFRERLHNASDDSEKIALLSEHAIEQTRISIEARNRVYGYHEHTHRELAVLRSGQTHLANGLLELTNEVRLTEMRRRADAQEAAERDGRLMRELGHRAQHDSIQDDHIQRHDKALTARQVLTYAASVGTGIGLIEGALWFWRHLP